MATTSAAELAARLDRLPMTRHIWVLVTLISLGGAFELYAWQYHRWCRPEA